MTEGPSPAPSAALAAWLVAPSDRQRLAALAAAAAIAPISGATIDRLSAEAISALQRSEGVRFTDLRAGVRAAVLIAGLAQRLGLTPSATERRDLEHLPFVMHVADGDIVVEVSAAGGRHQGIGQPFYHQWTSGITARTLVIDCQRMEHINSVLIAWMLQMVQSAKPVPVHVKRARAQVVAQLRQLRLDHLMTIA